MGDYRYSGLVNQTEYSSYPRRPLRNPLIRPSLLISNVARLGSVAMKADQFLMHDIPTERVIEGLKHVLPVHEKDLHFTPDQDLANLKEVIKRSNEVLATAKTVWPMTLFRDDMVVDRSKITITKRNFFFVSEVMSIRLEDILNVKVSLGPFFGSLTIAVRVLSSEDHHTINYFWRKDAVHLKHIVQGYIIAHHNDIECKNQNREELIKTLSELGHDNN